MTFNLLARGVGTYLEPGFSHVRFEVSRGHDPISGEECYVLSWNTGGSLYFEHLVRACREGLGQVTILRRGTHGLVDTTS